MHQPLRSFSYWAVSSFAASEGVNPLASHWSVRAGGDWRDWKPEVIGIKFEMGKVLGAGIDFVIVAFIVFWIAKKILREEVVAKK